MSDDNEVKYDEVDMGDEGVVAELDHDAAQATNINDFINAIEKQDFTSAEKNFQDLVGDRMQDALDQAKVKVASAMYNEEEPEEYEEPQEVEAELEDNDEEDAA